MSASSFTGRYRLTRNFALGALFVLAMAASGLTQLYGRLATEQVEDMAARNNTALTRTVTNSLWPRFASAFRWAQEFDAETIREHPQSRALLRDVRHLIAGTTVLKITFYDPRGRTVFSSDPGQIGDDRGKDENVLTALGGRTASALSFRGSFLNFDFTFVLNTMIILLIKL